MSRNMGTVDRIGRLVIAAILIVLAFGAAAGGWLQWVMILVAAVFTLTAIVGNCPAYRIIGLKTCKDC